MGRLGLIKLFELFKTNHTRYSTHFTNEFRIKIHVILKKTVLVLYRFKSQEKQAQKVFRNSCSGQENRNGFCAEDENCDTIVKIIYK